MGRAGLFHEENKMPRIWLHKDMSFFAEKTGEYFDKMLEKLCRHAAEYRWTDIVVGPRQGVHSYPLDIEIYLARDNLVGWGYIGLWKFRGYPGYYLTEWGNPFFKPGDAMANGLIAPRTLDEACAIP